MTTVTSKKMEVRVSMEFHPGIVWGEEATDVLKTILKESGLIVHEIEVVELGSSIEDSES